MIRRHDWLQRLHEFLEDPANGRFEWWTNDCVTFAAKWVKLCTDEDLMANFTEPWSDETSAAVALQPFGDLHGAVISVLGPSMTNPLYAKRGDVVLASVDGREFLAVHLGDRLIAPGPDRLAYVYTKTVVHAWSTGD
jgi:hypothetical protein